MITLSLKDLVDIINTAMSKGDVPQLEHLQGKEVFFKPKVRGLFNPQLTLEVSEKK